MFKKKKKNIALFLLFKYYKIMLKVQNSSINIE